MSEESLAVSGVHEFIHGFEAEEKSRVLDFWAILGFEPVEEGELSPGDASKLYGHRSQLQSVRLSHPGCDSFDTGHVRLQFWDELAGPGLVNAKAIDVGSRWMGIYTRDGLRVSEAFHGEMAKLGREWSLTPLVRAAFAWPAPEISLDHPFVGLREFVALGEDFRLAFVERVGFERPGFGTFGDALPFRNTEGTHANIVQPVSEFSTEFYKRVFGLETMANGEAHDSGEEDPTIEALKLDEGQTFRIERLVHPDSPAGMLQVYSPYSGEQDYREASRSGSRGLGCYSYQVRNLAAFRELIADEGATRISDIIVNEFSEASIAFDAPDGVAWLVTEKAA